MLGGWNSAIGYWLLAELKAKGKKLTANGQLLTPNC